MRVHESRERFEDIERYERLDGAAEAASMDAIGAAAVERLTEGEHTYSGVRFVDGEATVELKDAETKLIEGLPTGITYAVTEAEAEGFKLTGKTGDEGTITTGIARSTRDRLRMMVSDDPLAREAITTFRTLERFEAGRKDEGYSLLECHLYTGRTHQIRVHMRHIAHPCVGDQLYGRGHYQENLCLARQFLHSWHVAFDHPVTGEHISLGDHLPDDLREALASLSDRSMGRTAAGEEICPQLLAD